MSGGGTKEMPDAAKTEEHALGMNSGGSEETAAAATAVEAQYKWFRLLDLPDEIWSTIGKMVVDEEESLTGLEINWPESRWDGNDYDKESRETLPPINQTCKALRGELLPYYYSTKIDAGVYPTCREFCRLGEWLYVVGPENRRAITGLSIWDLHGNKERQGIWQDMQLHCHIREFELMGPERPGSFQVFEVLFL